MVRMYLVSCYWSERVSRRDCVAEMSLLMRIERGMISRHPPRQVCAMHAYTVPYAHPAVAFPLFVIITSESVEDGLAIQRVWLDVSAVLDSLTGTGWNVSSNEDSLHTST